MAIVKMRKFTLLFPEEYKVDLLKALQRFEQVHFRALDPDEDEEPDFLEKDKPPGADIGLEGEMSKVRFALGKITPYDTAPKGLAALRAETPTISYDDFIVYEDRFDHHKVCATVRQADEQIAACRQEQVRLRAFVEELKTWAKLDTSTEELDRLRTIDYIFGLVNRASLDQTVTTVEGEFPEAYTEVLGQIKEDVILLVLAPKDMFGDVHERLKSLGFSRMMPGFTGVPEELMAESRAQLAGAERAEADALEVIKGQAVHCSELRILLDYYETRLARTEATGNFLRSRTVIVCEGWMPDGEAGVFEQIVENTCGDACYYELSEVPGDSEDVPIKLKNNKIFTPFESITEMFALPKYGEIDPTPVVAPFYTFFFGLMVGDMAYGLIMVIATFLALKLFNLKEGQRRFVGLFFYLGIGTIVGGAIYGGFFGRAVFTPIPVGDGTYKAILDTEADIVTMLVASVVLGILHILFGIGVKGYVLIRDSKPLDALFDSGFWIVTLVGGIGFLLGLFGMVPDPYYNICKWAFILGVIGLALTQGRSSPSIGGKLGNGLYSVYGLSSYVGDFVSYTRIAALALSGAYIAYSFNLMMDMFKGNIVLYVVAGGAIFLVGQTLNFGLAVLGAYVHTIRLMYVEYFGKFYEGGGKPYKPLKLINNFVKVEK